MDVILVEIIRKMKEIEYENNDNERKYVNEIYIEVENILNFKQKKILKFKNFMMKKKILNVYVIVEKKILNEGMF